MRRVGPHLDWTAVGTQRVIHEPVQVFLLQSRRIVYNEAVKHELEGTIETLLAKSATQKSVLRGC